MTDSIGNRFYSTFDLILEGTGDFRHTIELNVLPIVGEALLGTETLPRSVLYFGGRHGSQRVRMETDDVGNFQGILPRDGTWAVEIENRQLNLLANKQIEVEKGEGVEIHLPDTEVFGSVVDSDNQRVPKAKVSLQGASGRPLSVATDSDGNFRFRGFESEAVSLSARLRSGGGTRFSAENRFRFMNRFQSVRFSWYCVGRHVSSAAS